ncbi:MAG: lipopolysaccharide transport periplasmic protein LptA [Pseudomonadales bacterium]|nr:lipopolysaccharide transport periplasmic protein LptA [Pseudomonadales bacterium]
MTQKPSLYAASKHIGAHLNAAPHRLKDFQHSIGVIAACFALLLLTSVCWALDDDRSQTIQIGSSSAFADYKQGVTVYKGNVELSQGSLLIKADQLNLYRSKEGFQKLVATGSPASFQQTPTLGKPPITAQAKQIDYDVSSEVLILKGDVFIQLEESSHQGALYEYNLVTQMLKASGKAGNRVTTTFQPQNAPQKQED